MAALISLATMQEATNTASVTAFMEERILKDTDWNLVKVRRRLVRLEPPQAYWASYRVRIGRGNLLEPELGEDEEPAAEGAEPSAASSQSGEGVYEEERELRLVARGVFDEEFWNQYSQRLVNLYGDQPCDPIGGLGYPVLFPETQHAFWFFPVDPNLTMLPTAYDPSKMRRWFRNRKQEVLDFPGRITEVKVELAKYLPEITAIIKYDIQAVPPLASKTVYGKVQNRRRGEEADRITGELWRLGRNTGGKLDVPKSLGYHTDLGLYLQDAMPGKALSSDRKVPEFMAAQPVAAHALALIHDSNIPVDGDIALERELGRLDGVLDQFAMVHPRGHFLLRELLLHIRQRAKKTREDEWVSSHGDYKYDQFIHEDGHFGLIDFDYFAKAETSFDLGKYCSHLVPSMPKTWEDSYCAEEARTLFLQTYREARPHATLSRFPIWEAVNLAGRSMVVMWNQHRGWERSIEMILVLAMERLRSKAP